MPPSLALAKQKESYKINYKTICKKNLQEQGE
jgi:hypothetical protein